MVKKPCFIQFEGVDLYYLEFKGLSNEEVREYMEESKAIVSKCLPDSVLFLVNASGVNYTVKTIRDFTNFSRYNGHFARATAIMGLSPEMRMLYNVALAMANRDKSRFKFFSAQEESAAKIWLKSIAGKEKEDEEKKQRLPSDGD